MTNAKATKRALISSVLALLLCFTMLLGTTFAWFTDSVASKNNIIKAGNLDIELYYQVEGQTDWTRVTDTSNIFKEGALWEPGHTEVVRLKAVNEGTLALKYRLGVNVASETGSINIEGKPFKLSNYIKYGIVDGSATYTRETAIAAVDATATNLNHPYSSEYIALDAAKEKVVTLVVYMPESVGNEANAKTGADVPTINLGINVMATQMTAESDSFDEKYDENATYADIVVTNNEEFLDAIKNAEDGDIIGIRGNVEWETGAEIGSTPFAPKVQPVSVVSVSTAASTTKAPVRSLTFVGLSEDATFTATGKGVGEIGIDGGTVTFKDLKIVDESVSYAEDAWEYGYLEFRGNTVFENCEVVNAIMMEGNNATFTNCTFNSNKTEEYAVWVSNGNATFTDCTFTGPRGLKTHEAYGSEVGTIVVDGCSFINIEEKPGMAIGTVNADTTIEIKNSTFINCQPGDQGLYVYETDTDVSTIDFTEKDNIYWGGVEVAEGLYYDSAKKIFTVASKAGLMNLNEQLLVVAPNEANIQTVNLICDVDLTGETWTPISSMWVTFNGNGHTISNLTAGFDSAGRRSGFWGYAGAVTINDLTLENVSVAGSQVGIFAGSAEGLKANNCFLKGTNTVTYVAGVEDWNGVGAITGVLVTSNVNVTIVEGATVKLIKDGFVTDPGCKAIDNLTGYLQANDGTIINNGSVQVIDLTIATADELFAFANDVNVNKNSYSGKTVVLTADIDLENKAWTSIGQTGATEFKGIFDGQGYTIKNLSVDNTAYTDEHTSTGLFGWAESGVTIQNVNVDGATMKGNHNVAVIVGYTYSSKIINCHVSNASVVCTHANGDACGDKAGTIVGYAGDESRITNCSASDSTIAAGRDAGQLIGCGYNVSISGCTATNVDVSATGDCAKEGNINNAIIGRVMG